MKQEHERKTGAKEKERKIKEERKREKRESE